MWRARILCVLLCINLVLSKTIKVPCTLTDKKCVSDGSKLVFPLIIEGVPGKVTSSDPIHLDTINLAISDFMLILNDAAFIGLKKCPMKQMIMNPKDSYAQYEVECSSVRVEAASFTVKGKFVDSSVKGSGPLKITYNNIIMKMKNNYIKKKDESGNDYVHVTNFTMTLISGSTTPEITGLSFDETENADSLAKFEEATREPLLREFIKIHVDNINQFLALYPLKDILYKNVEE